MTQDEYNAALSSGAATVEEPATPDTAASSITDSNQTVTPTLPPESAVDQYIPQLVALQSVQNYITAAPTFIPQTFQDQIQFVYTGGLYYLYLYFNGAWRSQQLNQPLGFSTRLMVQQYTNVIGTSLTKVQWQTVALDANTEWDTPNNKFVAKNTGVYIVYATGEVSSSSLNTSINFTIKVNGADVGHADEFLPGGASGNQSIHLSSMVTMNATNYLELFASRNGNGTLGDGTNQGYFMHIFRIA